MLGLGSIVGAGSFADLWKSCALMFVAFTGYGRIATLGEEVRDPARTIPRAIWITLGLTMGFYLLVGFVAHGAAGNGLRIDPGEPAALLAVAARRFGSPTVVWIVSLGAVTAMLGVLLNLNLGLSRVVLAMARRGDLPSALARIDATGSTPVPAVILTTLAVATPSLIGDVRATWSFCALTVLIYYAVTNWCALRLPPEHRRYPRAIAAVGLLACLALALFIEPIYWSFAFAILAAAAGRRLLIRFTRPNPGGVPPPDR
jgi:APA family basic amino acid/polyamine antiporter